MTADQSPLFPRASTDRLRTVLAARLPADPKWVAWIDGVVGELAGCVVEDPRLAQIRDLCDDAGYAGLPSNLVARIRTVLGAAPVAVTPPQGIDRDALERLLDGPNGVWQVTDGSPTDVLADRILALVRPVEGVVLTSEEAAVVVRMAATLTARGLAVAPERALADRIVRARS